MAAQKSLLSMTKMMIYGNWVHISTKAYKIVLKNYQTLCIYGQVEFSGLFRVVKVVLLICPPYAYVICEMRKYEWVICKTGCEKRRDWLAKIGTFRRLPTPQ